MPCFLTLLGKYLPKIGHRGTWHLVSNPSGKLGRRGTWHSVLNPSGVWCFIRKSTTRPKKRLQMWSRRGQTKGLIYCAWCLHHNNKTGETITKHTFLWEENWVLSEIHKICAKHKWMERMREIHRFTCTDKHLHPRIITLYILKTPQNGFVVCALNSATMVQFIRPGKEWMNRVQALSHNIASWLINYPG